MRVFKTWMPKSNGTIFIFNHFSDVLNFNFTIQGRLQAYSCEETGIEHRGSSKRYAHDGLLGLSCFWWSIFFWFFILKSLLYCKTTIRELGDNFQSTSYREIGVGTSRRVKTNYTFLVFRTIRLFNRGAYGLIFKWKSPVFPYSFSARSWRKESSLLLRVVLFWLILSIRTKLILFGNCWFSGLQYKNHTGPLSNSFTF